MTFLEAFLRALPTVVGVVGGIVVVILLGMWLSAKESEGEIHVGWVVLYWIVLVIVLITILAAFALMRSTPPVGR